MSLGETMKISKRESKEQETHHKGWGVEIWIENRPEYCGKLLSFCAGKKTSMHFHLNKIETMYVGKGAVNINLIDPENGSPYTVALFQGDSLLIPRGQLHEIYAVVDTELYEFSTTHEDSDSYRAWKGD